MIKLHHWWTKGKKVKWSWHCTSQGIPVEKSIVTFWRSKHEATLPVQSLITHNLDLDVQPKVLFYYQGGSAKIITTLIIIAFFWKLYPWDVFHEQKHSDTLKSILDQLILQIKISLPLQNFNLQISIPLSLHMFPLFQPSLTKQLLLFHDSWSVSASFKITNTRKTTVFHLPSPLTCK